MLTISGNLAVATYDGFKAYEHWQAEENGAAAGYVGLAFLNLLGAGLEVRELARASRIVHQAGQHGLLNSIEDAANFERQAFGNRFVGEDALAGVQGSLEDTFKANGMTFRGIFTGQAASEFVPIYDDVGRIIGGRISLVGTSQRQPLIRVIDEVSHALDAVNPNFPLRYQRLLQLGQTGGADRARVFAHFQLFRRAARRYEAGDEIMRMLLRQEDVGLLRQLANELRR